MISLFLLIFAFQNGLATGEADLRQIVNSLQLTVNAMSGKMTYLENEVKVRVVLINDYFTSQKRNTKISFLVTENHLFEVIEKQKSRTGINC